MELLKLNPALSTLNNVYGSTPAAKCVTCSACAACSACIYFLFIIGIILGGSLSGALGTQLNSPS